MIEVEAQFCARKSQGTGLSVREARRALQKIPAATYSCQLRHTYSAVICSCNYFMFKSRRKPAIDMEENEMKSKAAGQKDGAASSPGSLRQHSNATDGSKDQAHDAIDSEESLAAGVLAGFHRLRKPQVPDASVQSAMAAQQAAERSFAVETTRVSHAIQTLSLVAE